MENQKQSTKVTEIENNQSVKSNSNNNNQRQYTSDKDEMFRIMYEYKMDYHLMQ